ncbi:UNVERIFIED_CONTAM: hypothetical protein Scaly_3045000 [Sesamum calycinum]|uniref:DUF4283 domain-containing protein n=1 Tax=Sesamum calycinum TaxID=2727403 RepID=A0AAW2K3G3_9LAMI
MQAIRALSKTWELRVQQHRQRLASVQFARDDDRQRILAEGPYFIYGRPLLLKPMPDCFEFKEDDISLTPVWATLPSLPLECWHPMHSGRSALGWAPHRYGLPHYEDGEGLLCPYFVEFDASKALVDHVEFKLPNGVSRRQPVVYEYTPKFCTECNRSDTTKAHAVITNNQLLPCHCHCVTELQQKQSMPIAEQRQTVTDTNMADGAQERPSHKQARKGKDRPALSGKRSSRSVLLGLLLRAGSRLNATSYRGTTAYYNLKCSIEGVIMKMKEYVGKTFELGQPMTCVADSWRFQLCENRRQKNSLELHRPGMSSKILRLLPSRSDLMMPPQRDATLLGTPTVRAIPVVLNLSDFSTCGQIIRIYGNCGKWLESERGRHSTILSLQEIEGQRHLNAFNNLHFSHILVRAKELTLPSKMHRFNWSPILRTQPFGTQ